MAKPIPSAAIRQLAPHLHTPFKLLFLPTFIASCMSQFYNTVCINSLRKTSLTPAWLKYHSIELSDFCYSSPEPNGPKFEPRFCYIISIMSWERYLTCLYWVSPLQSQLNSFHSLNFCEDCKTQSRQCWHRRGPIHVSTSVLVHVCLPHWYLFCPCRHSASFYCMWHMAETD